MLHPSATGQPQRLAEDGANDLRINGARSIRRCRQISSWALTPVRTDRPVVIVA